MTPSSLAMLSQAITETLLTLLVVLSRRSELAPSVSAYPDQLAIDGLRRRSKFFETGSEGGWWRLLSDWDDTLRSCRNAPKDSTLRSVQTAHIAGTCAKGERSMAVPSSASPIELSLRRDWGDLYRPLRSCITSTDVGAITDQTISTCARTLLTIVESIIPLSFCSENCWTEESCGLTALRELTNYARANGRSLFEPMERVRFWRDIEQRAESAERELERRAGGPRASEVLFESASGTGDSAARGETRARVASSLTRGSSRPGVSEPGRRREDDENLVFDTTAVGGGSVSPSLRSGGRRINLEKGPGGDTTPVVVSALQRVGPPGTRREDEAALVVASTLQGHRGAAGGGISPEETLVTHALTSTGFDASEDGTGRGTPLVPIAFNATQDPITNEDSLMGTLSDQGAAVGSGSSVRRLSPTECERLMGWPDGWTLETGPSLLGAGAGAGAGATAFAENSRDEIRETGDIVGSLSTGGGKPGRGYPAVRVDALNLRGREGGSQAEPTDLASLRAAGGGSSRTYVSPTEEPFTFDWQAGGTNDDSFRGKSRAWIDDKPGTARALSTTKSLAVFGAETEGGDYCAVDPKPDGPRTAACGDGVVAPVGEWIGRRIITYGIRDGR
jgi:hypothetical protein